MGTISNAAMPNPASLFKLRASDVSQTIQVVIGAPLFRGEFSNIYKSDVFAKVLELIERSGMVFLESDVELLRQLDAKVNKYNYVEI